jgi:hypothetical protein
MRRRDFVRALSLLGWAIGRNVRIDTRWGAADAAQIRRHAAELAALAPDVILAPSRAAKILCRPSRQRDDQITMNDRWPAPRHNQTAIWGARECARIAHVDRAQFHSERGRHGLD